MTVSLSGPLSRKLATRYPPKPSRLSSPHVSPKPVDAPAVVQAAPAIAASVPPIATVRTVAWIAWALDRIQAAPEAEQRRVMIGEVVRAVADEFGVDRSEMVSDSRFRAVVRPRQVAMYVAKAVTPRSYPEIGRAIGGRDHTTVIHGVRKIAELIEKDVEMAASVAAVIARFQPEARQ